MNADLSIGARVVWRSGSHNYIAEKVGTIIFMGPSGWTPERAPLALKHWLSKEWRDAVRNRQPSYDELCQIYPAPGGGYRPPRDFRSRWTSRARYKFERCQSGITVAVHEYRQMSFDTAQATFKKPRCPLLYTPPVKSLKTWPVGARRPRFPKWLVGTWCFTVHHRFQGGEVLVRKNDEILFKGCGHSEKAARRDCINRVANLFHLRRSDFVIPEPGVPVDAVARRIDDV